jgi:hypothetical protein
MVHAARWALGGALLGLPVLALAGDAASTRDLVLDFTRSGAMKDLLGKTLSIAKGLLFFSAFLAYAVEAFGRSPASERDYAAVTWRLVVVLFLLWNYQRVFGGVIGLIDGLAREVAPESNWKALVKQVGDMQKALGDLGSRGELPSGPGGAAILAAAASPPSRITAWAYEALIGCVQLLAEGVVFLVNWLSKILTATLFILGPLALVAGIPRVSSTGTRWFHRFVTIASWPVFSGVLLSVLVTLGAQGLARQSYLECLVAALVMLVTALTTPILASHVIGGAMENLHAVGFTSAKRAHRDIVVPLARTVTGFATGIAGRVGTAVDAVRGRSSGERQADEGGGGAGGGGGRPRGKGGAGGGAGGGVANPPGGSGAGRPRGGRGAGGRVEPSASRAGAARPPVPAGGQGSVAANPPAPPAEAGGVKLAPGAPAGPEPGPRATQRANAPKG